jgi:hypothetical protein
MTGFGQVTLLDWTCRCADGRLTEGSAMVLDGYPSHFSPQGLPFYDGTFVHIKLEDSLDATKMHFYNPDRLA